MDGGARDGKGQWIFPQQTALVIKTSKILCFLEAAKFMKCLNFIANYYDLSLFNF